MSTIPVPDLSEQQAASFMVTNQRAALPPTAPREPLNRYQPLRDSWPHAYAIPDGRTRIGLEDVADKLNETLAQLDPEQRAAAVLTLAKNGAPPLVLKAIASPGDVERIKAAGAPPLLIKQITTEKKPAVPADTLAKLAQLDPEQLEAAAAALDESLGVINMKTPTLRPGQKPIDAALKTELEKLTPKQKAAASAALKTAASPADIERALKYLQDKNKPATPQAAKKAAAETAAKNAPKPDYEILQTGGVLSALVAHYESTVADFPDTAQQQKQPGPIFLNAVTISTTPDTANGYFCTVTIPEIGFSNETAISTLGGGVAPSSMMLPLNQYAPNGATIKVEVRSIGGGAGSNEFSAQAHLSYNNMRVKGQTTPKREPSPSEEVFISPYIQLDSGISQAFQSAGVPSEWYEMPA